MVWGYCSNCDLAPAHKTGYPIIQIGIKLVSTHGCTTLCSTILKIQAGDASLCGAVSTITTKIKLMQPPITTLLAFGYTMHGNSISILSNLEAIMPENHRGPLVPRDHRRPRPGRPMRDAVRGADPQSTSWDLGVVPSGLGYDRGLGEEFQALPSHLGRSHLSRLTGLTCSPIRRLCLIRHVRARGCSNRRR
jgi:hypothetical protein